MQFAREAQHLIVGFTITFFLVAIVTAYWIVTGPETILTREDNARLFEAEAAIRRGTIYDRHGEPLVNSVVDAGNIVSRIYHYPETFGVTGYYSLRYGVGGAESVFNENLRGDDLVDTDLDTFFAQHVLHEDQQGSEIRLTIDLNTQRQLVDAMRDFSGGAVVVSVPDGEIIAFVSLPTFDPNTLDENWDTLVDAEDEPFFNRVLQANYQPGGILQIALMAAARQNSIPLNSTFANATQTIPIDGSSIGCLESPPTTTLALQDAFYYGCAAPFAELATQLGVDKINQILNSLLPQTALTINNFVFEEDSETLLDIFQESLFVPQTTSTPNQTTTIENALGQGQTNVTVMSVAEIAAAILNNGNAPQPILLHAVRPPDEDQWIINTDRELTVPLMTSATAQQLQNLMIQSVERGTAQSASQDGYTIGGHTATALSGNQTLSWFTGFLMTDAREGYAVALVLENTDDYALAAEIGGLALHSAAQLVTE